MTRFRRTVTRNLTAAFVMLVGGAFVFALLYTMNELSERPEKEAAKQAADFKVEKRKKKKKIKKKAPKKRQVRQAQTARRAPAPDLATPLSGLSFDLPEFQLADLSGADQLLGGDADDKKLVMTEDAVDALPKPRSRVSPEYPAKARQRGIEGHVLLKLRVTESGEVATVRVIESKPIGVFEEVAVAAVQRWTFDPATYQGSPVAISVSQKIPFRLN